ncbi:MAG: 3-methylornithine--L-lysine ligase PylC [Candidatus Methanoplasma sp.]|jgi:pyrrolysine biosynthesis protein PylC|nr:3-methylornithine--L-lysine ligase PylC [Candidatus Methanoplasma sp.]
MRIGIVGGALQGMEAVFLSSKAGFETIVIDKKTSAPALSLSDSYETLDIVKDAGRAKRILHDCDAVIPACEDIEALSALDGMMRGSGIPFLFDPDAYSLSSSKERSNEIMSGIDVPMPAPWPECGFPAIVKPSSQSGSIGVSAVNNEKEMEAALRIVDGLGDIPIVQEFVSGKSVSIEVIGNGGSARSFTTTEVVLDSNYDCKMVLCEPNILPKEDDELFAGIGKRIAEAICLNGLMDVEAIYTKKGLRVLEVDARIPSQTPAAIWAATDVNILEELTCSSLGKSTGRKNRNECSAYEHYLVEDGRLITCGEKVFGKVTSPRFETRFFGADEAITDYLPGKNAWRATVITKGKTAAEVLEKRKRFIGNIMEECGLDEYIDRTPKMI